MSKEVLDRIVLVPSQKRSPWKPPRKQKDHHVKEKKMWNMDDVVDVDTIEEWATTWFH